MVDRTLESVAKQRMAKSMSRSDSWDGCSCNCNRHGGRSFGGSGKEVEELSATPGEEEDQGKLWFNRENSQAEWRSLFRLEREMDAALRFEHGDGSEGGSKASQL